MKTLLIGILIVSIMGNFIGAYFVYKAFRLRGEVKALHRYLDDAISRNKALKDDYPGLSVFADENQRLLARMTPEQRKSMTILYGASITEHWDVDKYFSGMNVINRGVSAQSDTQLLTRFSADVLQLAPGQVVIKFCSGNFQPGVDIEMMWDEYEIMTIAAEEHGINPLLATIIPVVRRAEKYENYNITKQIKDFNKRIRDFAVERNFRVVDYFQAMADKEGYLPEDLARDEIHPNEKGYEIMASTLKPFLD
ncbi:MAG: hypothetical protein B6D58_04590 [candidate division Zixibacteria bacterium 4484_95]|nr:MAG: hypothetical protein B6D58_04590 [candidate division Zixibacteria bacterium 4484_95]